MNLKSDCLACLFSQALRVVKTLECDDKCGSLVLKEVAADIAKLSLNQTPPEAAVNIYSTIAKIIGKEDLYEREKVKSVNRAFEYLDFIYKKIDEASCKVDAALRASVAGNVIDFATQFSFDLDKEIDKIFESTFAIDDKAEIVEKLKDASSFVLIGDNVGEHLYDKVLLEVIEEFYPDMEKFYFVRHRPIINDVTAMEAAAIKIDALATIVDSGVDTPGFLFDKASKEAKRIYRSADIVIAKGMGNFECMDSLRDERVYHLFKVKCEVVASRVGEDVGSLICVRNDKIKEE